MCIAFERFLALNRSVSVRSRLCKGEEGGMEVKLEVKWEKTMILEKRF